MPIGNANSVSMQKTLKLALSDEKISKAEAEQLAADYKLDLNANGPIGAKGSALTLAVIASENASKFEPGAEKLLLDVLGASKNEYGSYYTMPDGHYTGRDIYNTFQSAASDGTVDVAEAQKLLSRFQMFKQSNSATASRAGAAGNDTTPYYYRGLAMGVLLESLVLANEKLFTPDALSKMKVSLGLPLGPVPAETEAKIKEDGKVTRAEALQLVSDVKANVAQFGGTNGDPKPTLFNFRVEANALLSAPAKAALNAELGIDPNKISYQPTNANLRAVFDGLGRDNRISLKDARLMIDMSKQGTGTTDSALRDLKTLLALNPTRIDSTAKKELQHFVDTMSPKRSSPNFWGGIRFDGLIDSLPTGERVMKAQLDGGLAMQQAIARTKATGTELLAEVPMATGMMVNGTFVGQLNVMLVPLRDGRFEVDLVGKAPRGPSGNTGGVMTMSGGTFTADQLLAGAKVTFVGREVENR